MIHVEYDPSSHFPRYCYFACQTTLTRPPPVSQQTSLPSLLPPLKSSTWQQACSFQRKIRPHYLPNENSSQNIPITTRIKPKLFSKVHKTLVIYERPSCPISHLTTLSSLFTTLQLFWLLSLTKAKLTAVSGAFSLLFLSHLGLFLRLSPDSLLLIQVSVNMPLFFPLAL